jgi:isopentenyl phosphate kinase
LHVTTVLDVEVVIGGRSKEASKKAFPTLNFEQLDILDSGLHEKLREVDLVIHTAGNFGHVHVILNIV